MASPVHPVDFNNNIIGSASSPTVLGSTSSSSRPTPVAAGETVPLWATLSGAVVIASINVTGTDASANTLALIENTSGTGSNKLGAAGHVFNGTTWDRERKPNATSRVVSAAASTNATVAKASAGDVFTIQGYNAAATLRYLKIYNKATAPVVGTDVPVKTITLPATAAFDINLTGEYYSAGISYAFTTGSADADVGALAAGDITGFNLSYI